MIPLMPSGLYFAEGFVMSSICLMDEDGICFSNCATGMFESFPSTITRTFSLPRIESAPVCWSMLTVGRLFIISEAVGPAVAKSLPMFITFLSKRCSMVDLSATIFTSSNEAISSSSNILPRWISSFPLAMLISVVKTL